MRHILNLVIVLFIFAAIYFLTRPPEEITLKDLPTNISRHTGSQKPVIQEAAFIDSPVTVVDNNPAIEYYIIVESFKNFKQAQQKAEKLKNEFNANFIVLPPTTEGLYRISYGKYSSLEEAKSEIKSIRTTVRPDVWIFSLMK